MVTGFKALLMAFTAIVVIFSISVSLFLISYKITIFCIITIGFIYLSMSIATKKLLSKSSKWITQNDKLRIKILQEGIGNIRDVILNSNGYYFINRFHKANRKTRLANANIQFLSAYPRFLLEGLSIISIVLIAFYLQKSNPNENNVLPVLGTLALGMQRLLPSVQVFYSSLVLIKGNSVSIMSVLEKLNVPKVYAKREKVNFHNFKSIEIKNLSYKYPLKSDNILKNINFTIKRGEKIGIIGPTGCGKTTLINIFMGLLRPDSGDIIIDHKNIFETKLENYWNKYISHVPQNIFLSDNSIAENIAFGLDKNDIDLSKVINVSKKAQLHEFITSKKLGYQTNIGELGIKLSGGQRQRIAIARALYKNVNFLILDEATSALDTNCENILMEEIYRLTDISIIMIAHRLSTLSKCDKIIELKAGELANIYTGEKIKEIINK
jgi:ATP-binding cassette subfamily B protein